MKNFCVTKGVYPTMITPYKKDGSIDEDAVRALVRFYFEAGCDGIFAVCQSSEIFYLSLAERVRLAELVVKEARALAARDKSRAPLMIVASGHVSEDPAAQSEELNAIAATGVDALILISNRMDIANTSDEAWIAETEALIATLPADLPLGVYECPKPYKRLLSERMIKWCAESSRFYFVKDTCCDAALIEKRLAWCRGTQLEIFNANAQTLLETLRAGAAGYCGVMANFHPELYVKLYHGLDFSSQEAALLQSYLCLAATTESLTYPCCAKDYLTRFRGVTMECAARSNDVTSYTPYQRGCVAQLALLDAKIMESIGGKCYE